MNLNELYDKDYEISDMSAWITDGHNHDNYDWLIEAV